MDVQCTIISVGCYVELRLYQSDKIVNPTRVGGTDIRIRDLLHPQTRTNEKAACPHTERSNPAAVG
jgi:hypothetical protein